MPKLRNTENYINMEMGEQEREEFHRLKMVKAKKNRVKSLLNLKRNAYGDPDLSCGISNNNSSMSIDCLTSIMCPKPEPLSSTTDSAGDGNPVCYPHYWDDDDLLF